MGAGAYLGTRAETQVLRNQLEQARRESERQPYIVQEELLAALAKEGLAREAGYRVVKLLSRAPDALFSTAEQKLYGLSDSTLGNPMMDGLLMGVAFLVGALVPLLPFVMIASVRGGLIAGIATTAIALFAVGYVFEGILAGERSPIAAGLRFLAIALGAAAIGYLVGLVISPIGAGSAG